MLDTAQLKLASAHHKLGRGSSKNCKGEHLKLGLKFHIYAPITLGVVGVTSHEILPGDVAHSHGDNVDTNFTRGPPTKFGRTFNNFRV